MKKIRFCTRLRTSLLPYKQQAQSQDADIAAIAVAVIERAEGCRCLSDLEAERDQQDRVKDITIDPQIKRLSAAVVVELNLIIAELAPQPFLPRPPQRHPNAARVRTQVLLVK